MTFWLNFITSALGAYLPPPDRRRGRQGRLFTHLIIASIPLTDIHTLHPRVIRGDFPSFIEQCFQTVSPGQRFLPNWHIEVIAEHLLACTRGEITRLIINMPPRALKSITVSVAWPAWLLGQAPESRIMTASYAQALAEKHSMDCRLVMQSAWYRRLFPQTELSREQNEKHKFLTTARGMRLATSVFGAATGEGGNVLIADDPMNPLQAMGAASRRYINDWFSHTFATRLDDKRRGVIVLVMQRLHAEDISGYLLAQGGWEHLCLPAIAAEPQYFVIGGRTFYREAGALLHPAREDERQIAQAQRALGSAHFNAQYQQAPLAATSSMVKLEWFGRYDA